MALIVPPDGPRSPRVANIILCYAKATPDNSDIILAVVNLDPFQPHESAISFPLEEYGIPAAEQYRATDLISQETYIWTGGRQWVRLDPHHGESAHLFHLQRFAHIAYAEPCG